MKRDLHNAAVAMESFYTPNGGCYSGATLEDLQALGFHPSNGVTLTIEDATGQHYRLRARAKGGIAKSWVFDSSTARMESVVP
jgi:hypothetical protein